jgi:hypothetical protein
MNMSTGLELNMLLAFHLNLIQTRCRECHGGGETQIESEPTRELAAVAFVVPVNIDLSRSRSTNVPSIECRVGSSRAMNKLP